MPRTARRRSETDIYHITARGAGRRAIFEDDEDKAKFMDKLRASCLKNDVSVLAWCLMDNHYHLLLEGDLNNVSALMAQANTSLAHWYNGKYGHVGPVLQGRFSSTPVENDGHLLEVVRYIHLNPRDRDGMDFHAYPWSSYGQYVDGEGVCDTARVLEALGGEKSFKAFHEIGEDTIDILEAEPLRPYASDTEARTICSEAFGADFADKIATMEKSERNEALRKLHGMGISIRQLERLTGIGRGIIQPAVKRSY